ncbi:MAG TPA: HIT domain-containing protein [Spirochaetota bacterium]|nr:HIT domain-containing protein [Spirochaetota bacterium]HPC40527.1 HIT domain-containing protein [Spirochaetota bacterium]HPL18404.1 HIT domain-containing protein [Spirochaetota bacterium]HQF07965.1 HIT domain-containing protein [Spirochaetota bacterium]HQH96525.1 HIT domain-containing protein [Spirochaetota bacterium]
MSDYLFNTDKLKYVKGDKPKVECILCAIRDRNPDVRSFEVARRDGFIVSVNLYPFNPGHLMIFPERHVENLHDLTDREALGLHRLLAETITILKEEFGPDGFNVGYNLGRHSGASIPHLHAHVVPRYGNEVGFMDVLAGTRLVVADPVESRDRLRKRFADK